MYNISLHSQWTVHYILTVYMVQIPIRIGVQIQKSPKGFSTILREISYCWLRRQSTQGIFLYSMRFFSNVCIIYSPPTFVGGDSYGMRKCISERLFNHWGSFLIKMPFLFNQQTCQIITAQVDGYYKPTNALCSSCALVDRLNAPGHVHSHGILSHPNSGAGPAGINGLFPLNPIIHLLPRFPNSKPGCGTHREDVYYSCAYFKREPSL